MPWGGSIGKAVKAVKAVHARRKGWANYFRIGNVRRALETVVWYAQEQLRLFRRRRYPRKRARDYRRYPSAYFHAHLGL